MRSFGYRIAVFVTCFRATDGYFELQERRVRICIVSDGRQKIASRTLSVIATMGAYQDGVAKVCGCNAQIAWNFI